MRLVSWNMHQRAENGVPVLEVVQLAKIYDCHKVLNGVDFQVAKGQVKAVIGPSGSGKSTMLRLMALLEYPDGGDVILDGNRIGVVQNRHGRIHPAPERILAKQRTDIGMVFQSWNLFPHLNVLQNVMSALRVVRHMADAEAQAVAEPMLERVGLADKRSAFPSELSGGQQQRVAIARALVMSPKVMLFDEPTSALDPELVGEVLRVIEGLAADGVTMVVVTHEISFARDAADTVAMFDQGEIVEEDSPRELFAGGGHERTLRFLQSVQ